MLIPNQTPLVVPASEEKTFPHLWIRNLNILANSNTHGVMQFSLSPYNSQTKEIHDSISKTIRVDDLWKAVNEVPEVAAAFGAIINAVVALEAWQESQEIISQNQS